MPASHNGVTRRHIRIPSIVPVEYQLLTRTQQPLDPEIRTAFTRDLSEGGLCLHIQTLPPKLAGRIDNEGPLLDIAIDIGLPNRTLRLPGRVVWSKKQPGRQSSRLVGVEFKPLDKADADAIRSFAQRAARRPKIIRSVVIGLAAMLLVSIGIFTWSRFEYEAAIHETHEALEAATGQYVDASDRLGDMYVELRWLTLQVGEMVEMLDKEQSASDEDTMRPAMDDLASNIDKLRKLVTELKEQTPEKTGPVETSKKIDTSQTEEAP